MGGLVVMVLAVAIIGQQFGQSPTTIPGIKKMTCATAISLMPAFFTGKLEAAVMGQLEEHLDKCPPCREHYERTKNKTAFPTPRNSDVPRLAMRS